MTAQATPPGTTTPGESASARVPAVRASPDGASLTAERVASSEPTERLGELAAWAVAIWLIGLTLVALLAIFLLWPVAQASRDAAAGAGAGRGFPTLDLAFVHLTLVPDVTVLMLASLGGLLGSLVHTLTRLTHARGGRSMKRPPRRREALWFITSPVQGALLAFLLVAALHAGLGTGGPTGSAAPINLFTVVAVSGGAGLFSKRATARLAMVVNSGATAVPPRTGPAPTKDGQVTLPP